MRRGSSEKQTQKQELLLVYPVFTHRWLVTITLLKNRTCRQILRMQVDEDGSRHMRQGECVSKKWSNVIVQASLTRSKGLSTKAQDHMKLPPQQVASCSWAGLKSCFGWTHVTTYQAKGLKSMWVETKPNEFAVSLNERTLIKQKRCSRGKRKKLIKQN